MQKNSWVDCNRTIQWFFQQSGTESVILTNPNLGGRYLVIEIRSRSIA